MPHDDRVYLQHIRDAASRIVQYLEGIDENNFKKNHLIQDGVIRQIEIIGEAAKRLSPTSEPPRHISHGATLPGCETS
jgi:uncharacterized protein with HEPN domain